MRGKISKSGGGGTKPTIPSACESRSGWKSNQAVITNRVVGGLPQPLEQPCETQPASPSPGPSQKQSGDSLKSSQNETVSVAQLSRTELARRVVPKPKPCTEGEASVNAQTGSESNIVNVKFPVRGKNNKPSLEEGGCVNTQTGSMSNILINTVSVAQLKRTELTKRVVPQLRECTEWEMAQMGDWLREQYCKCQVSATKV